MPRRKTRSRLHEPNVRVLVCYSLGIYLLNLFLAFLTPKFDPSLEQELADQESEEGTSGALPTRQDDEFRPFIRR
jgi:Rer1 family